MPKQRTPLALAEVETSAEPTEEVGKFSGVVCLVPQDVPAAIVQALDRHFEPAGVRVRVTKGRRRDRRAGRDRRHTATDNAQMMERRFAPDLEARRFTERRGDFEQVEAPILPAAALPYAEKLRFVRRRPRPLDDSDLSRLRQLTEAWRDRAHDNDREARGLLRSLVGAVEDLRRLRTLSPRWLLAVRRGDQAIEEYRRRHVTR